MLSSSASGQSVVDGFERFYTQSSESFAVVGGFNDTLLLTMFIHSGDFQDDASSI